jgi:hypothetical protein
VNLKTAVSLRWLDSIQFFRSFNVLSDAQGRSINRKNDAYGWRNRKNTMGCAGLIVMLRFVPV